MYWKAASFSIVSGPPLMPTRTSRPPTRRVASACLRTGATPAKSSATSSPWPRVASAILVLERLELYEDAGYITSCDINPWVSCGRVMGTWQSELFGFPNPLIGIVAFAVVITTAMVTLSGASPGRWYWAGLQAGVTAGTVFTIWLWSQALFEIHILCLYCMIVWAAMIPLFILLTVRNLAHGVIPAHAAVVRFSAGWAGTLVAIAYVAVAASVFWTFFPALTGY